MCVPLQRVIRRRGTAQAIQLVPPASLKESMGPEAGCSGVWVKDPAEQNKHPRQVENRTYRLETQVRTNLTDLVPKEEKQMVLCHMPLIAEKASNACQPGQGAKGVVASAPPRPGLCPVAAQSRERIECWITEPTPGDSTQAEGPQDCHLTLDAQAFPQPLGTPSQAVRLLRFPGAGERDRASTS